MTYQFSNTFNFWFDSSKVTSVKTVCTIRTLIFLQWGIKNRTEKYIIWQLSHCIPQIVQTLFTDIELVFMCVTLIRFGCVHTVDTITPATFPFLPPDWVISSLKTVPLKSLYHTDWFPLKDVFISFYLVFWMFPIKKM